ncbi:MAG TPA: tetratricopeptide repeat protein, partial [Nitrospiraceae bacterium]|nr:tetratricopeptide repeat protein [Nitrospiraceae bacterium]
GGLMRILSIMTLLALYILPSGYAPASPPTAISVEELQSLRTQATQGNAEAQNKLGKLYFLGQSVPQNNTTAREWFEKSAAQGNADAQNNLGFLYDKGQGDYAKAQEWYEKAAAQRHAAAQSNLGWLYANGQGVPQDYVRAYMWWSLAAAHSKGKEEESEESIIDKVARRMTPAQIAEAQRLSQRCQTQHLMGC